MDVADNGDMANLNYQRIPDEECSDECSSNECYEANDVLRRKQQVGVSGVNNVAAAVVIPGAPEEAADDNYDIVNISCQKTLNDQCSSACCNCYNRIIGLEHSVTRANEEIAGMRNFITSLIEEVKRLQQMVTPNSSTQELADHAESASEPAATVMSQSKSSSPDHMSQVIIEVHKTVQDVEKRKRNVVITGFPEVAESDDAVGDDCSAFIQFCEENLSVKPILARKGCRRLGKRLGQKPRRLLVQLTSEESAAGLLAASKALRASETTKDIYINPDLSPIQAKLAYEQRQRRRAMRQNTLNVHSTADFPLLTNSGDSA